MQRYQPIIAIILLICGSSGSSFDLSSITSIIIGVDKDNIDLVKTYLSYGIQIRQVKNLPPMSFGCFRQGDARTINENT